MLDCFAKPDGIGFSHTSWMFSAFLYSTDVVELLVLGAFSSMASVAYGICLSGLFDSCADLVADWSFLQLVPFPPSVFYAGRFHFELGHEVGRGTWRGGCHCLDSSQNVSSGGIVDVRGPLIRNA